MLLIQTSNYNFANAFLALALIALYLSIGYAWTMLFTRRLTDGYWERTKVFGGVERTKMGAGTYSFCTLLWPVHVLASLLLIAIALIAMPFKSDFWLNIYDRK